MTAPLAIASLSLALCACAASQGSYGLGQGDANYDAIKSATQACQAQGGQIHLKNGYDGRELANYECKIGKAK
ncbi:MAG: hypothetical protein M3T55_08190 [Pseudomonadota bacterium]|nr:hypothetical protein [Pseudomonadota bacterium]